MKESTIIMMTKDDLTKFITEIILKHLPINNTLDYLPNINTYNRKEVCSKLDISYPTLLKLEKEGKIKGKKSGRKFFYTDEDLKDFIYQRV